MSAREHGEQRARCDRHLHKGRLSSNHSCQTVPVLPLGRDADDHRRDTPTQPQGEAQQVQKQPGACHEDMAERIAPSIGCRPEKPVSISCQCSIRSSPIRQQRKIGRSSRSE